MKRLLLIAGLAGLCMGQQGQWYVQAAEQTSEGHVYHLRGKAEMRGAEVQFRADQIDYDEDKAIVHLTGHITIETAAVTVVAEDVDYDVHSGKIQARQGEVTVTPKQGPGK